MGLALVPDRTEEEEQDESAGLSSGESGLRRAEGNDAAGRANVNKLRWEDGAL